MTRYTYNAVRSILNAKLRDSAKPPRHLREAGFLLRSAKRRIDAGDTGNVPAQAFVDRAAKLLEVQS